MCPTSTSKSSLSGENMIAETRRTAAYAGTMLAVMLIMASAVLAITMATDAVDGDSSSATYEIVEGTSGEGETVSLLKYGPLDAGTYYYVTAEIDGENLCATDQGMAMVSGGYIYMELTRPVAEDEILMISIGTKVGGNDICADVPVVATDPEDITMEIGLDAEYTVGDTDVIDITTVPAGLAKYLDVTFTSSDDSVISIDGNSIIAEFKGNAAVTATAVYSGVTIAATAEITVSDGISEDVPVAGVTISQNTATLQEGRTLQLMATIIPDKATNKNVSWSSDKPGVATVDENGVVKAVTVGTATITVTTEDGGFTATCTVTVEELPPTTVDVTGVILDKAEMELFDDGETGTLVATVQPSNATNKTVTWTSSDPTVATVDGNGVVTPLKAGTTVITVTTTDGRFEATCTVTVTAVAPDHIVVVPVDTVYEVGETYNGGVTVTLVYNNGKEETITEGFTVSPETIDTSAPGTYDVTVTYPGLDPVTYQVVVKAPGQVAIVVNISGGGLFGGASLVWDKGSEYFDLVGGTVVVDEGTVVTLHCVGVFEPTVMVDGRLVDTQYTFTASADVTITVMFPTDDDDDEPVNPPVIPKDDDNTVYIVAIAAAAVVAVLAAIILMQSRKS